MHETWPLVRSLTLIHSPSAYRVNGGVVEVDVRDSVGAGHLVRIKHMLGHSLPVYDHRGSPDLRYTLGRNRGRRCGRSSDKRKEAHFIRVHNSGSNRNSSLHKYT